MPPYIYDLSHWPKFSWNDKKLTTKLAAVRHHQGRLIGRMEGLGFKLRAEAILPSLTEEIIKSSEIEGQVLGRDGVRSSIARRLGMDVGGVTPIDRGVEGVVEVILDATQQFDLPLTKDRLVSWHGALFPSAQVTSGYAGKERVHYEAPAAERLENEMRDFLEWFNAKSRLDPVIEAAIAHLWFVTIHPFEDGNGRIARAIADMALARSEKTSWRFYSLSAQIRIERTAYYDVLEATQKGGLDITAWLEWFLGCLDRAFDSAETTLASVLAKARFWDEHAEARLGDRQRFIVSRLLSGFQGKLTSSKYAILAKCSQDTAGRDIDDLIKQDILVKDPGGGRSTSYSLVMPDDGHGLSFPDREHQTDTPRGAIFWGEDGESPFAALSAAKRLTTISPMAAASDPTPRSRPIAMKSRLSPVANMRVGAWSPTGPSSSGPRTWHSAAGLPAQDAPVSICCR